jgi:hypothetical protein
MGISFYTRSSEHQAMIEDAIAHLGLPERIPLVGSQLLLR